MATSPRGATPILPKSFDCRYSQHSRESSSRTGLVAPVPLALTSSPTLRFTSSWRTRCGRRRGRYGPRHTPRSARGRMAAMSTAADLLAPGTGMGAVTLRVADLDGMIRYYRDGVQLDLLALEGGRAVLGRGTTPIVILEHAPGLQHAAAGSAGLFHTAILFETRADLAAALYSVASRYPNTFTGSADHLVSLAFYMTDPEGNGVELYWDRDRSQWSWTHGHVEMSTLYLDPNRFLDEHLTQEAMSAAAQRPGKVGHVHLSVGDVATAERFYAEQLGFAVTTTLGRSALFVSAGGYHHHMAMNVWSS